MKILYITYPVDDVVDAIIDICLCIKHIGSKPMIFISFQEQMSEGHQILIFEGHHHFIAQTKSH